MNAQLQRLLLGNETAPTMENIDWNVLRYQIFGTEVQMWLIALGIAIVVMVALTFLFRVVLGRLARLAATTRTNIDDFVVDMLQRTKFFFIVAVALYVSSSLVDLPSQVERLFEIVALFALLFQTGIWANAFITKWLDRYRRQKLEEDASSVTTMSALSFVARLVLWTVLFLFLMQNLGFEITSLIAGLGIGGIAIALAVQNILGDLFASLSIVLDKPFVIGDFLIIGDHLGTVEYIGLKTTRIRSLSGEQIIFSNSDLLNSRIRNFKRMYERRIVFEFGVVYETPPEKLETIPPIVQEIIESLDGTRFDRAHFFRFGDFSLDFQVVYYVLDPSFVTYMDIQQAINLELYRRLQAMSVEFAFPTQTIHVAGGNGRKAEAAASKAG